MFHLLILRSFRLLNNYTLNFRVTIIIKLLIYLFWLNLLLINLFSNIILNDLNSLNYYLFKYILSSNYICMFPFRWTYICLLFKLSNQIIILSLKIVKIWQATQVLFSFLLFKILIILLFCKFSIFLTRTIWGSTRTSMLRRRMQDLFCILSS